MWLLISGVVLLLIYFFIYQPYQYWKNRDVPYTTPVPILGNMWKFFLGQLSLAEVINDCYNKFPDRRYFGFYQFATPCLVVRDVELLKKITIKDFENFIDRREFISPDADPLFGRNLFALKGQQWKSMRATLSPAFSGSKLRQMFDLMYDCAEKFTNHLLNDLKNEEIKSIEMKDAFSRYTSDVIATCAFGIECDSMKNKENEFYVHGKEAIEFTPIKTLKFFGYTISPFIMKYCSVKLLNDKCSNFFRDVIMSTIKFREEKNVFRPDMIQLLMEARKGKLKHEGPFKSKDTGFTTLDETEWEKKASKIKTDWDDDDLTAQAVIFYFAGFETSSTMLCHLTNELAQNEDIQKRLQEEIDETTKSCGGKLNYDALVKMKYMDMVLSESMRKWPVSPMVDRYCVKPYTIYPENENEKPLQIEKGVNILIPIIGIHRDPILFPKPEIFDPERFSDERKHEINPFALMPFGLGPRGCIGSRFSILEAKVICASLLSKFDLSVVKETQIPLQFKRYQFNTLAEKGFWIGIKKRQK